MKMKTGKNRRKKGDKPKGERRLDEREKWIIQSHSPLRVDDFEYSWNNVS